jgi:hypothetical protein
MKLIKASTIWWLSLRLSSELVHCLVHGGPYGRTIHDQLSRLHLSLEGKKRTTGPALWSSRLLYSPLLSYYHVYDHNRNLHVPLSVSFVSFFFFFISVWIISWCEGLNVMLKDSISTLVNAGSDAECWSVIIIGL